MSQPQAQSQLQKRNANDFFKPYARSIPEKRPSPQPEEQKAYDRSPKKPKKIPKTPSTARTIDLQPSPYKSPFRLGRSPKLPIRSPRPNEQGTPCSRRSDLFSSSLSKRPSPVKVSSAFSFSDLPKLDRSVVKDGKVIAVRDSDEDDSESLESLEDIFGRSRGGNTSSSSPPGDEAPRDDKRPSVLGVFSNRERQAIVGKARLRDILTRDGSSKFDIRKLISDHLDDAETKEKLDTAHAYYAASAQQAELERKQLSSDRDLLLNIIDGKERDQGEVSRVLGAMERTGALTSEQSFSFFGGGGLTDWMEESPPQRKFPKQTVPQDLGYLRHSESRDRAYLFGDMEDLAKHGELPGPVLQWTFESIASERRDELRNAYVRCLEIASPLWTRTNFSAQDVHGVFETLGANTDVLRDGADIVPNRKRSSSQRPRDSRYLLSVLETIIVLADDLDFTALSKLSSVLTRLSLDDEAMSEGQISTVVEEAISRLLTLQDHQSRLHVAERILTDMSENLKDSSLQARLLRHILPTSTLTSRLRSLLAQTFLLNTPVLSTDLTEPPFAPLPALLQYLRSSTFNLTHRSDSKPVNYTSLAALTSILDIAISDGAPSSSFDTPASEKAFNHQIDSIADRVGTIFSSIADTGASHMRRTEAKEALGVLQKRVLYAVRTRPRPKKSVFGGRDGKEYRAEESSKNAMSKYLTKKQEVDRDTISLSQQSETERLIRGQLGLSQ